MNNDPTTTDPTITAFFDLLDRLRKDNPLTTEELTTIVEHIIPLDTGHDDDE